MALFDFLKRKEFEEIQRLKDELSKKIEHIKQLSKYEVVVDAELKANELISDAIKKSEQILFEAENKASELLMEAERILSEANSEATLVRQEARTNASNLKQKAESLLNNATTESAKIIKDAHVKAVEIAGEAYKLKDEATNLEKTIVALKNIAKGYGDEYIIPSFSLLDDLAEEYGYTEAGEELKNARERSRLMVKNGTAASCEYVEDYRKTTAINFIIDAFNGKVDSILSTVKHDNYGILKQRITDSYYLVNNLGKAFRNAVISPEYLESRLRELQYAVMAVELKRREQEEQRRIKDQLREEEKAQREIEKALRDVAKEEELLTKAMEKVRAQLDQANDEQRAKLEAQIEELNRKWQEAEERNKRALSMAQQTRSGHVYIISNIGSFGEDTYKIGMTRRLEPLDRVRELGDASVPFPFDVHAMIWSNDAPTLETELHRSFVKEQLNKVNPRKEFFRVALNNIRQKLEGMDIQVNWTILAQATEYRESLAIEKALKTNAELKEKWELSQEVQMEELEGVED